MKEIRTFIISEIVIILIKLLGGLVANSYTMIASAVFDITLLIIMLVMTTKKENKKFKGVISSILGFIFILLGLGIIYLSVINKDTKMSFWIILFVFLSVIIRYLINCIYTSNGYQRKKGLLSISLINSNMDFYNYGIILGALVLAKCSRWISVFSYADILGTILIAVLIIYKGLVIIRNSFKYLENEETLIEDKVGEIEARSEVKKVQKLSYLNYGGIRKATCELVMNDGINMVDLNSFVVTLQDFLLKSSEIVRIDLVEDKKKTVKRKPKVRSLKQDARNSRSGNSKTNTKKKSTKKKNKKR